MRKRTNKLLAVLLTGAMAMSMGACGNGGASTDNTQKKGSDDQVKLHGGAVTQDMRQPRRCLISTQKVIRM